jgi:hypothetical protein
MTHTLRVLRRDDCLSMSQLSSESVRLREWVEPHPKNYAVFS